MAHRLAPEAETELGNIWYYVAKESGSIEIADRLIDSITERFYLLASHPHIGRHRDEDLRAGLRRSVVKLLRFPVQLHDLHRQIPMCVQNLKPTLLLARVGILV